MELWLSESQHFHHFSRLGPIALAVTIQLFQERGDCGVLEFAMNALGIGFTPARYEGMHGLISLPRLTVFFVQDNGSELAHSVGLPHDFVRRK